MQHPTLQIAIYAPFFSLLLLSLTLITLTNSAPLTFTDPTDPPLSLSLPFPTSSLDNSNITLADFNTSLSADSGAFSNGKCASSSRWTSWNAPAWNFEDCYSAVQQFYLREVYTKPDEEVEFVGQNVGGLPQTGSVRTPRKYTVRMFCFFLLFFCPLGFFTLAGQCSS